MFPQKKQKESLFYKGLSIKHVYFKSYLNMGGFTYFLSTPETIPSLKSYINRDFTDMKVTVTIYKLNILPYLPVFTLFLKLCTFESMASGSSWYPIVAVVRKNIFLMRISNQEAPSFLHFNF